MIVAIALASLWPMAFVAGVVAAGWSYDRFERQSVDFGAPDAAVAFALSLGSGLLIVATMTALIAALR